MLEYCPPDNKNARHASLYAQSQIFFHLFCYFFPTPIWFNSLPFPTFLIHKALFGWGDFERKEWERKEMGRKDVILPYLVVGGSMWRKNKKSKIMCGTHKYSFLPYLDEKTLEKGVICLISNNAHILPAPCSHLKKESTAHHHCLHHILLPLPALHPPIVAFLSYCWDRAVRCGYVALGELRWLWVAWWSWQGSSCRDQRLWCRRNGGRGARAMVKHDGVVEIGAMEPVVML